MTTEFLDPRGDSASKNFSPEARSASALQLTEELSSLKTVAEPVEAALLAFTASPAHRKSNTLASDIRGRVVEAVAKAIAEIAAVKNIPITPDYAAALSACAVEAIAPDEVCHLLNLESAAVVVAAETINRMLDVIAATRVIHFMWELEGFDQLDTKKITAHAQQWMANTIANDAGDRRYRWPETAEMVIAYFKARSSGPVAVRYPEGRPMRALYSLDPLACRRKASKPPETSGPPPLLIHCPGLPGTTAAAMPDGRCVKKLDDGVTVTMWWKDGKLHRDPEEGAAVTFCNYDGHVTLQEYWVNGTFERIEQAAPEGVGA
jgi:hypothetical protein